MDANIKKTCPNCSQPYTLKSISPEINGNIPLFLSCGHSMCENCIRNIIKFAEPIECRVCKRFMEIDKSDVLLSTVNKSKLYNVFPVNINMLGEIVLQSAMGSKPPSDENDAFIDLQSIICGTDVAKGECMECHKPTSKMCQQCATVLCEVCFNKIHKNFIIFKDHSLQNIESLSEPADCEMHNKPLEYYCKDCQKTICMNCLFIGGEKLCKNHNVASLKEVNESFKEELVTIAPKVDEVFRRLTKTADDVGHILYNVECESDTSGLTNTLKEIDSHFSKLFSVIQKHKEEVTNIVLKMKNSEVESLKQTKKDVVQSIKKAKTLLNAITASLDPNTIKVNYVGLLEKAKEVIDIPWYLSHDEINKDPLKLAVNEDLCSLINDYIHLEGNANAEYKLRSTSDLGEDFELPPAPKTPVFPPVLAKDVRKQNKKQQDKVEKPQTGSNSSSLVTPTFFKSVPKYRNKSGSHSSLNSIDSDSSYNSGFKNYGSKNKKPHQHVQPYAETPQQPTPIFEGSQLLVYMSHIINPHNFYVQRASDQGIVKEMMRDFRNADSWPKPSLQLITEGRVFLAYNRADKGWHRCRITSVDRRDVNKPVIQVFCVDFGSTETVNSDKLRLLPPARQQSPYPLAIHCSLANCKPKNGTWTSDDSFLIQKIIDNKQAVIHVRHPATNSDVLDCDVITFEHGISLAHALVFHDRAVMPNPRLFYPKIMGVIDKPKIYMNSSDFKMKSVEEVYITHIVNPDKFFVTKRHLRDIYEKISEDLEQEYTLSDTNGLIYLPEVGTVCVVNTEKLGTEVSVTWARGVVLELPGRGRVRLHLVDTGATVLVHWTALRIIQPKFTTQASLATECHLSGVTPYNKKWCLSSVAFMKKFEEQLLELHVEDTRNRGSIGVTLYDNSDEENPVCINTEMFKYKFAVNFGIFNFNKNNPAENQVITNKSPLDKPKPKQPRPNQITILKKEQPIPKKVQSSSKSLDAKDKGPLRLEVKLIHYQSPSLLYVSLVHQQKAFNELFEQIQLHYTTAKSTEREQPWKVGDRCCTICQQSKTWRRAAIVEIEEGNAKVFYSDFACIETVPLSSLRELTTDFASVGDAAIKCHLSGVIPAMGDEWPSLTKEFLKELLDAYKRIFITKMGNYKDSSMPIEVWVYHTIQGEALEPNKSEWRCLNKSIIDQGLGIPEKQEVPADTPVDPEDGANQSLSFLNLSGSVREWLQLEPMPTKPSVLPDPENPSDIEDPSQVIDIAESVSTMYISDWSPPKPLAYQEFTGVPTYVDNDGIIFLHDVSQQDTLDLIRKALDVRFNSPDPKAKYAKWSVGEPCIAQFFLDSRFYRGRVLEVNNETNTCRVQYIDYGNEEICTFDNMRKSLALYQIPTQAHRCVLARIKPPGLHWDRQTLDYIHRSVVEKQCYIKVTGPPIGGVLPIEMKFDELWINDHLVDFEMAVYTDGTKAVVPKYAPVQEDKDCILDDSGPDYIVQDESEGLSSSFDTSDFTSLEGKDWNTILEEDEASSVTEEYAVFPKFAEDEFLCTVTTINDLNYLELTVIQEAEKAAIYENMFSQLQKEGSDLLALNGIFEHKACVARFSEDEQWYRASILQYSESKGKLKVLYVDYGNTEVVMLADVREITEEYLKLPPLTVTSKLYGVKVNPEIPLKKVAQEYSETFLDKGPFRAKVINREKHNISVELRNEDGNLVYDSLIENGVLTQVLEN